MDGFLKSEVKSECCGCEACAQACQFGAIHMVEDNEGFRYPVVDRTKCIKCNACEKVCPAVNNPKKNTEEQYVFGGYILNEEIKYQSTSGGAFSAIADSFCDCDYVVFGAKGEGLKVYHCFIDDKNKLDYFRKSKYSQSIIGDAYKEAKRFLGNGKKVLFSGTPCQIAGLYSFLGENISKDKLLTVEVVCESVPSPLYVRKLEKYLLAKYGAGIEELDYREKGRSLFGNGKWDFETMRIVLTNKMTLQKERWFNPFWSIWLQLLMSRPSCYHCQYASTERVADITLGDLWGVHLFCKDLYGKNGGSSLVVGNTEKGKKIIKEAEKLMYGHQLKLEDALKYQRPMRCSISENPQRKEFMDDLKSDMPYNELTKKWAKRPGTKLLFSKYIWGNRQRVGLWSLFHRK